MFTYFVFQTINCMPLCAVYMHNTLYSEHGISERFYDISYAHRSFCYTRFIHVVGVFLALLRCDEMLADTDPIIMGKCVFFSHFYRAKTAKTDPSVCAQASIFVQKKIQTHLYTHIGKNHNDSMKFFPDQVAVVQMYGFNFKVVSSMDRAFYLSHWLANWHSYISGWWWLISLISYRLRNKLWVKSITSKRDNFVSSAKLSCSKSKKWILNIKKHTNRTVNPCI